MKLKKRKDGIDLYLDTIFKRRNHIRRIKCKKKILKLVGVKV